MQLLRRPRVPTLPMALILNLMNTRLKADIEEAIQETLNTHCDDDDIPWSHYLHPALVYQMTEAAALVFDSSQDAQDYFEKEN